MESRKAERAIRSSARPPRTSTAISSARSILSSKLLVETMPVKTHGRSCRGRRRTEARVRPTRGPQTPGVFATVFTPNGQLIVSEINLIEEPIPRASPRTPSIQIGHSPQLLHAHNFLPVFMVLPSVTYFFGGAGGPLGGGAIPFMRRYSTIWPYSSEAWTTMNAARVQRVDGMVAPDGERLPHFQRRWRW